jgi:hypothetical protein
MKKKIEVVVFGLCQTWELREVLEVGLHSNRLLKVLFLLFVKKVTIINIDNIVKNVWQAN